MKLEFKTGTCEEIGETIDTVGQQVLTGTISDKRANLLVRLLEARLENLSQSIEVARLHGRRPRLLPDSMTDDLADRPLRRVG